jgi:membrane protease YdiL (CAAX protease family)
MNNKTKGTVVYLLITFLLAWALWEIPISLGLSLKNPLFQFFALPGTFSPAIAAFIVRKWVTHEGFGDAGLKSNLKTKWRYYLVAWLLPLFVSAIIIVLVIVLGIAYPDFTFQRAIEVLAPGTKVSAIPSLVLFIAPIYLLIAALFSTFLLFGEEFGWRGYLQMRLFSGQPLLAAISTGIIWGIWHYPINIRGYNFPDHPILGLLVFPVTTVMLSIIFGWLRLRSGSIWTSCLAHAATNSIGASLTLSLFLGGGDSILFSYLGLIGWIPLGALCLWIVLTGRLKTPGITTIAS